MLKVPLAYVNVHASLMLRAGATPGAIVSFRGGAEMTGPARGVGGRPEPPANAQLATARRASSSSSEPRDKRPSVIVRDENRPVIGLMARGKARSSATRPPASSRPHGASIGRDPCRLSHFAAPPPVPEMTPPTRLPHGIRPIG